MVAKLTKELFVARSVRTHGNKYSYDNSVYLGVKTDILIFCKACQISFYQTPDNHMRGKGCPKCKCKKLQSNRSKSIDSFIYDANNIHNKEYCYKFVVYKNTHTKVKIKHKKCGNIFYQTPHNHLAGNGCPNCFKGVAGNSSKIELEWIKSLNINSIVTNKTLKINNKNYYPDGYDPLTNTVYEFNGDYWHGNPAKFKPNDINIIAKKTFGELYKKTLRKEETYKKAGYNVVSIWESDYDG